MNVLDGYAEPLVADREEFQSSIEAVASTASYKWRKIIPRERLIEELWEWVEDNADTFETVYIRAESLTHARAVSHVVIKRACFRLIRVLLSFYASDVLADVMAQAEYQQAFIEERLPVLWTPHHLEDRPSLTAPEVVGRGTKTPPQNVEDWKLWVIDLRTAFMALTPQQRAVLEWSIGEGATQRVIGERLGISHQAVGKLRERGLARLAKLMNGDEKSKQVQVEEFRRSGCAA